MRVNIYQTKNPNSWIKGCNSLSTGIAYRAGLIGVIWFFYQLDNPSIASLSDCAEDLALTATALSTSQGGDGVLGGVAALNPSHFKVSCASSG